MGWIIELSTAAPVPSDLLLSIVREDWIPVNQREPLYKEILRLAQSEVASKAGESRNDAEYRLRNARRQYVESLVNSGRFPEAAALLSDDDDPVLALQIAAHTGSIDRALDKEPYSGAVERAAAAMRERGEAAQTRQLLDAWYRRQLDSGVYDASTFLGLAEVLLEANQTAPAVALLRRMVLLTPEPFETLMPASQLLQRFKQTTEAREFLAMRVRAVPWDGAAKVETGGAGLRGIAADPQMPYRVRATAASKVSGEKGLGSQELDLLASGQPQAAAVERPYFHRGRVAAVRNTQDQAVRARLLRGALAIKPNDTEARLELFRSYTATRSWAAAVGVFEPQIQTSLGEWLRQEDAEGQPGSWIANGFLREHPERARIALELANAYRLLDRLPAVRALLVVAREIDPTAPVAADLTAIQTELARRAENRARMPVINKGVEQAVLVRPKLGGGR
jgi:hypothetical protein